MFQNSGLSLDQAPPVKIIFNFFMMASFFGLLGGTLLAILGAGIFDFSSNYTVILTHLFTIGMMSSFMIGALFQMLPVLAGVTVFKPVLISYAFQVVIAFGLMLFFRDLIWDFSDGSFLGSMLFAFLIMIIAVLFFQFLESFSNKDKSSLSLPAIGMSHAIINLALTALIAFELITILDGNPMIELKLDYQLIKELHIQLGTLGWGLSLIAVVSFQVVEMFYVTNPIPKSFRYDFTFIIMVVLIFKMAYLISIEHLHFSKTIIYIIDFLLGIIIFGYGLLTIGNLFNQKRRVIEATILFWRVGIISLMVFSTLFMINSLLKIPLIISILPHHFFTFIGWFHIIDGGMIIAFATFVMSIIFAMVYKIVPFLVWFHLNAKGYFTAPLMHEVISPKYSKAHLYLHLITIFLAIISLAFPHIWQIVGVLLAISYGILFWAIFKANLKYKDVIKNGQKFKMPID